MLDPHKALNAAWSEYRDQYIPPNVHPSQYAALGYAYYRGMSGLMEILHKATSAESMPNEVEIAAFMNGLGTALDDFHDVVCPPEPE